MSNFYVAVHRTRSYIKYAASALRKVKKRVDDLLYEIRLTNQLLRLAFGQAIEARLEGIASLPNSAKVLAVFNEHDEVSMDRLQALSGVPRSSLYALVAKLERQGAIERPRRGYVALSKAAAPYLTS
jgi:DNA-binding MarR family transcriptional regulator